MKSVNKYNKGITMIALIVTIIVLLILASVATYSGMNVINSSKLTTFTAEMKIMQTQVNSLYQKYKNDEIIQVGEDVYKGEEILTMRKNSTQIDVSTDITNSSLPCYAQANLVFTEKESNITDKTGYLYFNNKLIEDLGIEGVKQEFFINIKTRSIVSYSGLNYEGNMYYTLNQLPNGLYNVEYKEETGKPTFSVKSEKISSNKWRITISDIVYDGYINKWQVKYQLDGSSYWNTSEDMSFVVNSEGIYNIKIVNGQIESDRKIEIIIGKNSVKTTKDLQGKIDANTQITGTKEYINLQIEGLDKYNVTVEPSLPFEISKNGEYEFKINLLDEQGKNHIENKKIIIDSYVDEPEYWINFRGTSHIELNNINQDNLYKEYTIATKIKINKKEQQSKSYMGIYGNHLNSEGIARQFVEQTSTISGIDYTPYYDKWTDIVGTYNITTKEFKTYINGEIKSTYSVNTLPYQGFNIGTSFLSSDRQMIGQMSCLKIWNKEISADDIAKMDLFKEEVNVNKENIYANINLKSEEIINKIGTFVGTGHSFKK